MTGGCKVGGHTFEMAILHAECLNIGRGPEMFVQANGTQIREPNVHSISMIQYKCF